MTEGAYFLGFWGLFWAFIIGIAGILDKVSAKRSIAKGESRRGEKR